MQIIPILLGLMTHWAPPVSADDAVRYDAIASQAFSVASERDWLGLSSLDTAVMLLAIASYESGFRADIDSGRVRGSRGEVCLGQIQAPIALREQAAKDRNVCFRMMLQRIAESRTWCRHLPLRERLSGYTVGRCVGSVSSRKYTKRFLEGVSMAHEISRRESSLSSKIHLANSSIRTPD